MKSRLTKKERKKERESYTGKKGRKIYKKLVDWLILTAYQSILGYFMPIG